MIIETGSKETVKMGVVNRSNADSRAKEKVTLPKAFAKIDPFDLARNLNDLIPSSVEELISKLVVYFGRPLSRVTLEYKYPWSEMKYLELIDFPFCHIPDEIYNISADWIEKVEDKTLCNFVIWSFEWTRNRLAGETTTDLHPELGVFAALSMILLTRPRVLSPILPLLRPPKYHIEKSPEMIPFIVWMTAQVAQVDICTGLHSWACNLLPLVRDKFQCDPRSMNLIMHLMEKVLSHPLSRGMLLRNAARPGKPRLFPVTSFEILLPLTFRASFEKVNEDTERFEKVYPLLKEVALSDAPGIEEMKKVTQHIFAFSFKFAGGGNAVLAKEATSIAIWCLTKNVDCCNHWDKVYMDNLEASVALLENLADEWKDHSPKLSSSPRDIRILNLTMKNFVLKNERGLAGGGGGGAGTFLYEEADKYCREISRRLSSSGIGFLKGCGAMILDFLVAVVAAAADWTNTSMHLW
ncbi:unnamed protein product [Microthlaspi erraticum]|uniref:Uncharacterized protein n=1 Tax=Microthlaspi erraticum TaxID=1685480 RepID=A0A6D2KPS1_9BRAS|nr:unnamed protein product [Microthlaspi erraticum]